MVNQNQGQIFLAVGYDLNHNKLLNDYSFVLGFAHGADMYLAGRGHGDGVWMRKLLYEGGC